jgi:hypothetical protein
VLDGLGSDFPDSWKLKLRRFNSWCLVGGTRRRDGVVVIKYSYIVGGGVLFEISSSSSLSIYVVIDNYLCCPWWTHIDDLQSMLTVIYRVVLLSRVYYEDKLDKDLFCRMTRQSRVES